MRKRIFSLVLLLVLMLQFVPVSANEGIIGDADANGVVDVQDLMCMVSYINNPSLDLTAEMIATLDVYKDSYFNIRDVLKMAQYLAGWNNVVLGE